MTPNVGDTIVVWFSHGAASAMAWKLTEERFGAVCDVVAVNNPVKEEDPDNVRFGRDVARWVGKPLLEWNNPALDHSSAEAVWDKAKAMSFPRGAPCTLALKKQARQAYENQHRVDWHVLGFTADERARYDRFVLTERDNVLPVLIDAGLTKEDCFEYLSIAGLRLPAVYRRGYPNANCIGCVKATSPTYWNHVRQQDPEVFAARAEQSRRLGAKLVRYRGQRIFLDELPPDARGRAMKTTGVECGIFCEERLK